jgi:glutamine synthetase
VASTWTSFAQRCGVDSPARREASQALIAKAKAADIRQVRVAWCDLHGSLRSKTLPVEGLPAALGEGITMASTLLLKDTSERTVLKVFEGGAQHLGGFAHANNVRLVPDPTRWHALPWAPGQAWLMAQPFHEDGSPVVVDARRALQQALAALHAQGFALRCGLEVEFHIYRLVDDALAPEDSGWPGAAPTVRMLHPGYRLISDEHADACADALDAVRGVAEGLGLPLQSLEIEMGPSQFEAVFGVQEALDAADSMVLLRNGVRQALRRRGLYATFCCLPPFDHVMASGWHLHHSLVGLPGTPGSRPGGNAFVLDGPSPCQHVTHASREAQSILSDVGCQWLAGLLAHARGMTLACVPTANGHARFRPNALAPQSVGWGVDNRGAMVRVLGAPGDPATRLENRLAEPAANPYLMMAAHVHAGLDGLQRKLRPALAVDSPYSEAARQADPLPSSLLESVEAFEADTLWVRCFGEAMATTYATTKRFEAQRFAQAGDPQEWMRREYFARL